MHIWEQGTFLCDNIMSGRKSHAVLTNSELACATANWPLVCIVLYIKIKNTFSVTNFFLKSLEEDCFFIKRTNIKKSSMK